MYLWLQLLPTWSVKVIVQCPGACTFSSFLKGPSKETGEKKKPTNIYIVISNASQIHIYASTSVVPKMLRLFYAFSLTSSIDHYTIIKFQIYSLVLL